MKSIIICTSIHHQNTLKIANAMAEVLNCPVVKTEDVNSEELKEYDLIGFGSGIYGWRPHQNILKLAEKLPELNKSCFIFSTSGGKEHRIEKWHKPLREILLKKGLNVMGEFNCVGWDSFGPLKWFGGLNKEKPNQEDLNNAKAFVNKIFVEKNNI